MRSTTKLKLILLRYTVTLDINDEEQMILMLTDKVHGGHQTFSGQTYSVLVGKAYSWMMRELKSEEKRML
ncbi:MAG: hypothetical protein GC180_07485 [Bacteroidetes bacterium]|nr:hypothetical protein [Bacteroidota bacterium]